MERRETSKPPEYDAPTPRTLPERRESTTRTRVEFATLTPLGTPAAHAVHAKHLFSRAWPF